MKNKGYKAPDNIVDNRIQMSIHQEPVPDSKISYGSVANKYPVILDGGKTIIFISDKRKESKIRQKYEQRLMSKRALK